VMSPLSSESYLSGLCFAPAGAAGAAARSISQCDVIGEAWMCKMKYGKDSVKVGKWITASNAASYTT
jgi:hypothetical protein